MKDSSFLSAKRSAVKSILAVWLLLLCCQVQSAHWQENPKLADLFSAAGIEGTFVLYDVHGDRLIGHNRQRAKTRFIPASTFKIANSLIGLTVGAVKDVEDKLPYGGQPQPYPQWERDMGLREAIAMSNVPVYQELARRIGLERMRKGIELLDYGNRQTGNVVDNFWLKGPLEISPLEQVHFLAKLAQGRLPVSADVQKNVRDILLLEQTPHWKLYGKTGVQGKPGSGADAGTGWWVGWVEKDAKIYPFALNVKLQKSSDIPARVPLGKDCLEALGLL